MKLCWKSFLAFFLCACLLLSVTSCKKGEDSLAGKSFRWALSREPKTLDPQIASGEDAASVITAPRALPQGLRKAGSIMRSILSGPFICVKKLCGQTEKRR